MTTSKTLTASVAAAALVGAISLAYAQTSTTDSSTQPQTSPNAPMTQSQDSNMQPSTQPNSNLPAYNTAPSSSTLPSSTDSNRSSSTFEERAPQSDRN